MSYRTLLQNGLWHNNPALVQLLGLCPLLAVSNNTINALGLALASIFVLTLSNTLVSLSRKWLRPEVRIPIFVLIIATSVTVVELLIQAYAYALYQALGIYLPLIVTNCVIIARAESYAVKHSVAQAAVDGASMGLGFAWVIVLLGAMRELLATGAIFAQADRLFGQGVDWTIRFYTPQHPMTLALLPAGAFIVYAFIIAGKNALELRKQRHVSKKHS